MFSRDIGPASAADSNTKRTEASRAYGENGFSIRAKPNKNHKQTLVAPHEPEFEFVNNHVVTDHANRLVWQKTDDSQLHSWSDAITYCDNLDLDSRQWRLPNRAELLSLVDFTRTKPSIDTAFFPNTKNFNYWASTPYTGTPEHAWSILFSEGNAYCFLRELKNYVRCVSEYE